MLALCAVGVQTNAAVVYLDLDGNEVDQSYTASNLYVEMYAPANPSGVSVMIYPGGAYAWKGMTYEGSDFAPFYNELGITVFVVSYQLPYGNCTAPLQSCERFMRAAKNKAQEWNIDPDKIGVMGSSAGGHLASTHATAFSADTRPAFQVLLYPVISMSSELTHAESRTNLLGATPSDERIYEYSNELQVKDLDDSNHNGIGNQFTFVHVRLCSLTKLGTGLDRAAEDVSGCDGGNVIFFGNLRGLGTFTRTGSAH